MERKNYNIKIGMFLITIVGLFSFLGPLIYKQDPFFMDFSKSLLPPSKTHLLGTDEYGRDFLSRLMMGGRLSLLIGIAVVGISSTIGTILGTIFGYIGGLADDVFSRIIDLFLAFPGILLALTIVSITGPGIKNIIIALTLMGWVSYGRLSRGITLKLKKETFVLSAKSLGAGTFYILRKHIIPFIMPVILIQATLSIAGVIIAEAGLSFLGLGVPIDYPSLGSMINEGRNLMLAKPFYLIMPSFILFIIIVGFSYLGEGLKEKFEIYKLNEF